MMQFLRFAAVGVLNTAVGYAVIFACMYLAGIGPVLSNVIGYGVGLVCSYVLNRTFTFRSAAAPGEEIVRFVAIFLIAYLANLGVLVVLIRAVGVHEGVAQFIAGATYSAISFFLSKYYVFASAPPVSDVNEVGVAQQSTGANQMHGKSRRATSLKSQGKRTR